MGLFDNYSIPEMFGLLPGLAGGGISDAKDLLSISDNGRTYAESASFMGDPFGEDNNTYDMIMGETGDPLAAQEATENQIVSMLMEDFVDQGYSSDAKIQAATNTISSLEAFGLSPKDAVGSVAAGYGVPQGELQTVIDHRDKAKQSWKDTTLDENYLGGGLPEGMFTSEEVVLNDTSNQGKLNDEIIKRTQNVQEKGNLNVPEEGSMDDPNVVAALLQLQEVFSDNYNYSSLQSFGDQYFLSRINEILDNYNVNANANEIYGGWGPNPRIEVPTIQPTATTQTTAPAPVSTLIDANSPEYLDIYGAIQRNEIEFFSQNDIGGLFVDNNKNVYNLATDGSLNLYSLGQMESAGESGGIEYYNFGNEVYEYNPSGRAGQPWNIVEPQTMGTAMQETGMSGFQLPPAALTDYWSPEQTWEAMRVQQMGEDIYNPVRWGARNVGFAPAKGQYLLSGANRSFTDWMSQTQGGKGLNMADLWDEAVEASSTMGTQFDPSTLMPNQLNVMNLLGGDAARENALLMSYAALGGGPGVGGRAMYSQLGSMYDIFAAQQAAQGLPASGFLEYLDSLMAPGAIRPATGPAAIETPHETYAEMR